MYFTASIQSWLNTQSLFSLLIVSPFKVGEVVYEVESRHAKAKSKADANRTSNQTPALSPSVLSVLLMMLL